MAVPNTPRQGQYHEAVVAQQHNLSTNLQDTLFTTPPSVPVPDGKTLLFMPVRARRVQQPFIIQNLLLAMPVPDGKRMLDMPVRAIYRQQPFIIENLLPNSLPGLHASGVITIVASGTIEVLGGDIWIDTFGDLDPMALDMGDETPMAVDFADVTPLVISQ